MIHSPHHTHLQNNRFFSNVTNTKELKWTYKRKRGSTEGVYVIALIFSSVHKFDTLFHFQMPHDPSQTVPKCVDPPASVYTEGAISRPTEEESNVTTGGAARGSAFFAGAADDRELISAV